MEIQLEQEIDIKEKIRFELDGNWLANDIIDLFSAINDLYNYYSCISTLNGFRLRNINTESIKCIGYINQKILGKATTFIDTSRMFYYFDRDANQKEKLALDYIPPLKLIKFQYASPGFSDFAGFGEVVGHLKEMCFKLIDLYSNRNKKRLEEDKMKLENQLLEIERNKQFLEILERIGFDEKDTKIIIAHEFKNSMLISKLIDENKITGIS